MLRLYKKIATTGVVTIPVSELICDVDVKEIGPKLEAKIKKLFRGSLAIREVDAGSTNAEEQEINALCNPWYDMERFGVHIVASPRHADMLFVTGPVARNMAEALKRAYEATPDPKIVVAVGDAAIDGGIFKGSYATVDGVHNVVPVDFGIPGDPPSPKVMICALLYILEVLDKPEKKGAAI